MSDAFTVDAQGAEYVPVDGREDVPVLDALPPAAEAAPLVPVADAPVPVAEAPVATPTTPPRAPHDPPTDDDEEEGPQGLPAGHLAAGGASAASIAGTVLYQVGGALGLAAGGAAAGIAGIAYARHRWAARKGGSQSRQGRQQTRTIKTTQTRTTGSSGGVLGGRGGAGRGAAGRGSSRMPGLGGRSGSGRPGGRQGGKALWSGGRSGSAAGGRSGAGRAGMAGAAVRAVKGRTGRATASDGGGALRVPGRKNAQATQTAAAKTGKATAPAQAGTKGATPGGQGARTGTASAATTPGTATRRPGSFGRRAERWHAARPGRASAAAVRVARRADAWEREMDRGVQALATWLGLRKPQQRGGAQEGTGQDQQAAPAPETGTAAKTPENAKTAENVPAAEAGQRKPEQAARPVRSGQTRRDRRGETHGRTRRMSGFPLVAGAAEMAAAAAAYEPEDMWTVNEDLKQLGEMPIQVATAIRMLTARLEGEYPIHESVTELLRQLHDLYASSAALADQVAGQFQAVHADDIKRDEQRRVNEQLWNVR
jgi:hypothetical protein